MTAAEVGAEFIVVRAGREAVDIERVMEQADCRPSRKDATRRVPSCRPTLPSNTSGLTVPVKPRPTMFHFIHSTCPRSDTLGERYVSALPASVKPSSQAGVARQRCADRDADRRHAGVRHGPLCR